MSPDRRTGIAFAMGVAPVPSGAGSAPSGAARAGRV